MRLDAISRIGYLTEDIVLGGTLKHLRLILLLAGMAGICSATQINPTTVYSFTGSCSDCTFGSATLTVQNYTPEPRFLRATS